jgi:hypothetical protein
MGWLSFWAITNTRPWRKTRVVMAVQKALAELLLNRLQEAPQAAEFADGARAQASRGKEREAGVEEEKEESNGESGRGGCEVIYLKKTQQLFWLQWSTLVIKGHRTHEPELQGTESTDTRASVAPREGLIPVVKMGMRLSKKNCFSAEALLD